MAMSEAAIRGMKDVQDLVYMNLEEGWAVVTVMHGGHLRLGIRWFDKAEHGPGDVRPTDAANFPLSHGHPVWFILPPELHLGVLHAVESLEVLRIKEKLESP